MTSRPSLTATLAKDTNNTPALLRSADCMAWSQVGASFTNLVTASKIGNGRYVAFPDLETASLATLVSVHQIGQVAAPQQRRPTE